MSGSQNNYAGWKKNRHKKSITHKPFTLNSRICKQIYCDKRQVDQRFPGDRGTGAEREGITKGHKETLETDGYAHYLNCGDGFRSVYICQNYQIIHFKYIQLIVYQLYLNTFNKCIINIKHTQNVCGKCTY